MKGGFLIMDLLLKNEKALEVLTTVSLAEFLILTVVSRLILPIVGGTLPSGMADEVDIKTGRQKRKDVDDKRQARKNIRKQNRKSK